MAFQRQEKALEALASLETQILSVQHARYNSHKRQMIGIYQKGKGGVAHLTVLKEIKARAHKELSNCARERHGKVKQAVHDEVSAPQFLTHMF